MPRSKIKEFAKVVIGFAAEKMMPGLARDIDEGRPTGKSLKLKRAIVHSRVQRAKWRGDEAAAKKAVDDWWKSDVGDHFYDQMAGQQRFEDMFLGPHYPLVERLKEICGPGSVYSNLVEVGCGDGLVLRHLSETLSNLESFTGLDISERIIERNRAEFADHEKIDWQYANVLDWIGENDRDGTVLFSYGGVMEYLNEEELTGVYAALKKSKNVAVALAEPMDVSYDAKQETESRFIGTEHVYYCHNYAHILRQTGYRIEFEKYLSIVGWPWVMVIAVPE